MNDFKIDNFEPPKNHDFNIIHEDPFDELFLKKLISL